MSGIQTFVGFKSPKAIPGMIADVNDCQLVSAVMSGSALPGTWVELALGPDGELMVANSPKSAAGTLGDGGVLVYDPMQDPAVLKSLSNFAGPTGTGFQDKAPVTVLRRGRITVATDAATTAGSTGLFLGQANVQHPSTTAASATNTNGFFTIVAATTTSGVETTAAKGCTFVRMLEAQVALLDVNRPAADR